MERTKKDRSARYLLWGLLCNDFVIIVHHSLFGDLCVHLKEWALHGQGVRLWVTGLEMKVLGGGLLDMNDMLDFGLHS